MRILLFLLPLCLAAQESFISEYEYGEMLYDNPRGVSCKECHGASGKGKTIVQYKDIHGKQKIYGADIRNTTLKEMSDAVNSYHKIMPRYYLTTEEIKAIYKYLQKRKEKERN